MGAFLLSTCILPLSERQNKKNIHLKQQLNEYLPPSGPTPSLPKGTQSSQSRYLEHQPPCTASTYSFNY
jgi:hypothetical protein